MSSPDQFYKEVTQKTIKSNDIFLIDIHLNCFCSGIQIAQKIRSMNKETAILFTTSDSFSSIEVINTSIRPQAYILKDSRNPAFFSETLKYHLQQLFEMQTNEPTKNSVIFTFGGEVSSVESKEINYIQTDKMKRSWVNIYLTTDEVLMIRKKFSEVKTQLAEFKQFIPSKSHLINLENIKSISRQEEYIQFKNDEYLYVGKKVIDKVRKCYLG